MPCDAVNTARQWLLVFTVDVRVTVMAKGNGLSQVRRQQSGIGLPWRTGRVEPKSVVEKLKAHSCCACKYAELSSGR